MNPTKFAGYAVRMWRAVQAITAAKTSAQKTRAKNRLCKAFDSLRADLARTTHA